MSPLLISGSLTPADLIFSLFLSKDDESSAFEHELHTKKLPQCHTEGIVGAFTDRREKGINRTLAQNTDLENRLGLTDLDI